MLDHFRQAMLNSLPFRYIVTLDSEFHFGGHATPVEAGRSGERPQPVCLVAKELRSGRVWRLCCGEFGTQQPFPPQPPFPIGADAVVCLHASSLGRGRTTTSVGADCGAA